MNDIQYIEKLAHSYFSGTIALEDEKSLLNFINESPENGKLFRKLESEWMEAAQQDEKIHAEWVAFDKKRTVREALKSEKLPRRVNFTSWRVITSIASLLVIAFLSTLTLTNYIANSKENYVTVEAPIGEKSKITLSDGTIVWLNSGSKLTCSDKKNKSEHIVKLSGEGYFEVAKNKSRKFIVRTHAYDVEVVGTKFNVAAYADDRYVTTTLLDGKVKIQHKQENAELNPGESISFDTLTGILGKPVKDLLSANAWVDNAIIYDNITLNQLITRLSRKYDVNIILQSQELGERKFNIALRNDETIEDVMSAIEKILHVKTHYRSTNYYIGEFY